MASRIAPTRPWRQAQTCGLTYCTVLIPARFRAAAAGLLKSGASMPMNASTWLRSMRSMSSRRNFRIRRKCGSTSKKPMTAISSARYHGSQPAAIIFGPAMPTNSAPGACSRNASISPAPSVSPDASPATSANRSGRVIGVHRAAVVRRAVEGPSRDTPEERPCGSCAHIPVRTRSREGRSTARRRQAGNRVASCAVADALTVRRPAVSVCPHRASPGAWRARDGAPRAYRDVLAASPGDARCGCTLAAGDGAPE